MIILIGVDSATSINSQPCLWLVTPGPVNFGLTRINISESQPGHLFLL